MHIWQKYMKLSSFMHFCHESKCVAIYALYPEKFLREKSCYPESFCFFWLWYSVIDEMYLINMWIDIFFFEQVCISQFGHEGDHMRSKSFGWCRFPKSISTICKKNSGQQLLFFSTKKNVKTFAAPFDPINQSQCSKTLPSKSIIITHPATFSLITATA